MRIQMFKKNSFLFALMIATAIDLIYSIVYIVEDLVLYGAENESFTLFLLGNTVDIIFRLVILVLLILTHRKDNPRCLIPAAVLFLLLTIFYNGSAFFIGYVVLCFFAYWRIRNDNKERLPLALAILYFITLFSSVIQYINDVIPSQNNEAVYFPEVNKQFYIIALFFLAVAVLLAFWGAKTERLFFIKTAVIVYLIGLLTLKFLAVPSTDLDTTIIIESLVLCFAYPEFLLSLYQLSKKPDDDKPLKASTYDNERKL